jgi:hypothetical protein
MLLCLISPPSLAADTNAAAALLRINASKIAMKNAINQRRSGLLTTHSFATYPSAVSAICGAGGITNVPNDSKASTATALSLLQNTKNALRASIYGMGADITEQTPLDQYAQKISSIDCCLYGGQYRAAGIRQCSECGIGYYCPAGSNTRYACTYGAIACNGATSATDIALPPAAEGKTDRILTYEEVLTLIPPTSMSQWRLVDCCPGHTGKGPDSYNTPGVGCVGTIGPGTYAFLRWYYGAAGDQPSHETVSRSNATIAVFDKPVGYKILHAESVYDVFIDMNNATYQAATWRTPFYNKGTDDTNIGDFAWGNLGGCALGIWVLK